MCSTEPPVRQKIPKDGWGPRGKPDCYYTSRTLESTFRYRKFVKRLRQQEEEERIGAENKLRLERDCENLEFFAKCDRKSLINKVARRVDLCMKSYENDLKKKRERLSNMLKEEEEANIRKFVKQAQEGAELVWQQKQERLKYLIEKRKKEHLEKYKDTPISKCAHATACVMAMREKQAQEIQLYQMKEKQAMREQEKELDAMWYAVAMSEADALKSRMEQDAIERLRRDNECTKYTAMQLRQRAEEREREKERLKQETLHFRNLWEEDQKKEDELERLRAEKRKAIARDCDQSLREKREQRARADEDAKMVDATWNSLAAAGVTEARAQEERRKAMKVETNMCNNTLIKLRDAMNYVDETFVQSEAKKRQDAVDKKRCEYLLWSQKTNRDVREAMIEQIKDRAADREKLAKLRKEENEYQNQIFKQMDDLCGYKDAVDAQKRKRDQQNLVDQIEYNKLLKERALQEEMDQRKKAQLATEQYQKEIADILCRDHFSDIQHPFTKQMEKNYQICPCSKNMYCKVGGPITPKCKTVPICEEKEGEK